MSILVNMDNFFRYLSEDPQGVDWGVRVLSCGYQHVFPGETYPLPGHPDTHEFSWETGRVLEGCYIVYIPTGSGELEIKSKRWEINPGDVMILAPREWHRYRPAENTGWEEYWIGFQYDLMPVSIQMDLFPNGSSYIKNIGFQEELFFLFNQSMDLVKRNTLGFRKILVGIALQLIAYIVSFEPKLSGTREQQLTERAISHIKENLSIEIDFKDLAHTHNLSYNRFRTIFKNETGFSLQQYLIYERLQNAKRLIINTNLSIKEVALKTGFNSEFYFSKIFKKKIGYPPGQIRKKRIT